MSTIAERLATTVAWKNYDTINGEASDLVVAINELLSANDAESAEAAYWKLENRIVVQGTVYSAAVPATSILVAALMDTLPMPVRISILDLLFQILTGASYEPSRDLIGECKKRMTEGIWLIVREFAFGPREAARDLLERLDHDIDYHTLL